MEPNSCLLSKEVYSDGVDRVKIVRSWNTASIILFIITILVLGSLIYLFYIRSKLSKEEQSKYWKYQDDKKTNYKETTSSIDRSRDKKPSRDEKDRQKESDDKKRRKISNDGRRAYELYKQY